MLRPKRDVYGNMLPFFLPSWKEIPDETLAGRVNIERDRFLSPLPFGRKRCERKRRKEGKEESEGREKSRGSRMREREEEGEKKGEKDWSSHDRSEYCQGRVLSCPASKIIVDRT